MSTLQTTPDCMPVERPDDLPAERVIAHEPRTMSWLQMASVNFPGPVSGKELMYFGCPYLQRAVRLGQRLDGELRLHPSMQRDNVIDNPVAARCLRLFLAADDGAIDNAMDFEDAEKIVGIRDAHGQIKEEWK